MHKFLVLAVAGSGFILMGASNSAQLVSPEGPPTIAEAATVVAAPGEPVRVERGPTTQIPASGVPILLEAGKGTLIRLPRPAGTVFIANPDVADVQVKSPSLIYLNAKAPGETVLYAVDAEDRILLNAPVRVEHDISRVRQSVRALAPGEDVTVKVGRQRDRAERQCLDRRPSREAADPRGCGRQRDQGFRGQPDVDRHAEPGHASGQGRRSKPFGAEVAWF